MRDQVVQVKTNPSLVTQGIGALTRTLTQTIDLNDKKAKKLPFRVSQGPIFLVAPRSWR